VEEQRSFDNEPQSAAWPVYGNKESTLRKMNDSQNEFAYSQMRDMVDKSIKSNLVEELTPLR